MCLYLLSILLLTTALDASQTNKRVTTLSSPQRKLSNTQETAKGNEIITLKAMKSDVAKANDVIIQQEHNLLGVTMAIVTRLMEIKSLTLSDMTWEILSRLFEAAMSVIFGPNTNIIWPEFAQIVVQFLKLLTT